MYPHPVAPAADYAEGTPFEDRSAVLSALPLERFEEYVIVGTLGQGGMAKVLLALAHGENGFRKLFAVKCLRPHAQVDPEVVSMFVREATLAARLQHPNVVQTQRVGQYQGQHFIAMEYLEGQPLNALLSRLRADEIELPSALAARVVSEALSGLHYAHEATDFDGTPLSIVHRDVSPQNIFITLDGQVKLLDFGISKGGLTAEHTRTGTIKGKFAYLAPEQARGEAVDRRADLWSMGVTLWEALAGRRLFRGASEAATLQATMMAPIPYLTEIAPHVPDALASIVDRALQRNRDKRWSTAEDFKARLDEWLSEQTAASAQVNLSGLVRAVFADAILSRREVLCACLARVDADERQQPVVRLARDSVQSPPLVHHAGHAAPTSRTRLLALVGAAVLTLGIGAVYAFGSRAPASIPSPSVVSLGPPAMQGAIACVAPAPVLQPASAVAWVSPGAAQGAAVAAHTPAPPSVARGTALSEVRPAAPRQTPRKPAPTDTSVAPTVSSGRLLLDSTPYAIVSLGSKRLGITPLDLELPEGAHVVTLRNPEQGVETTYRVTIPRGGIFKRRIALD